MVDVVDVVETGRVHFVHCVHSPLAHPAKLGYTPPRPRERMDIMASCLGHAVCCLTLLAMVPAAAQDNHKEKNMPRYQRTSYAGESVALDNGHLRLVMFKRLGGWGWGEIYTPEGKLMAVLDHLGEVMLRDQDIPMRLEADTFRRESTPEGERLVFAVRATVVSEKLKGTSFDNWMHYPLKAPCLVGEVSITLLADQPLLKIAHRLKATGNYYARYIRGPWLRVGEASFGVAKDDSILPGVEWTVDDEWSSGPDWFKDPWALRAVPHPNKVAIPLMALSHEGTGIGLSWNPNQTVTRWFNYRGHHPQPVFATPNFIDRMNNSLFGLMVPDASIEGHENEVYAEQPLELRIDQRIDFDSEIWLTRGRSLDVVTDWVKRHGLPDPGAPRWPFEETLDRIAQAYNTNFWHEGKGFGTYQHGGPRPRVPAFVRQYMAEHPDAEVTKALQAKVDWCEAQQEKPREESAAPPSAEETRAALIARGKKILENQREDGGFFFDPDGLHYRKDDFTVARAFIEPMGLAGDAALDLSVTPIRDLLDIAEKTGDATFREAAHKALEFCMPLTRPEAGDFWETPLHAPNLFAAGHAAIAFYTGYQAFGDPRYKEKAIYWIRAILPFTHLWEPKGMPMLYNTKPCLCSSDWYFANWVRDHVQWEVLAVFAESARLGFRWDEIDPEIDWRRFHEGITMAAMRWMVDHTQDNWRPHNLPDTLEGYRRGEYDMCFPDTHNSTTGNYGGMFIMPDAIIANIRALLERKDK